MTNSIDAREKAAPKQREHVKIGTVPHVLPGMASKALVSEANDGKASKNFITLCFRGKLDLK